MSINKETAKHPVRVVIVDDSTMMRKLLASVFSSASDIEVVGQATNGEDGVELVNRLRPDLVTMDVVMPEMDGIEATRRIMADSPTPIIVVTSKATSPELNVVFDAMKAGALDVMAKPEHHTAEALEKWGRELMDKVRCLAEQVHPQN